MTDAVRLAVVGCGGISQAHANGYEDLWQKGCREFTVTACCDVVPERAENRADQVAAFQGTRPAVFSSVDDLIAAECADAADVCTPHYAHHLTAIPLLESGLHTMVEKPMGITIRATRAIMAAASQNNRVLAVAEQVRRGLKARACRWAICERKLIGDVRRVVVQAIDNNDFDYSQSLFKWRGVKLLGGGGMIMDSGAHFTDMMLHLFGDVYRVSCTMETQKSVTIEDAPIFGTVPMDVEDTWNAALHFASGTVATWAYSRTSPGTPLRNAVYYGSEGSMRDLGFPFHCFQGGGEATLADGTVISSDDIVAAYREVLTEAEEQRLFPHGCTLDVGVEVWDFIDSIRSGREPEMGAEQALRAKALCEACFESAALGAPVRYHDVLDGNISDFQDPVDAYWGLG